MSAVRRVKPKSESYKPKTMLDSGAFSAWFRQTEIDLDAYIDFIEEHGNKFCSVVALDKIPGDKNMTTKSVAMMEESAAQSYKNFRYMQKHGVDNAIPVFHQGEDFKWLRKMLDERVPYIGISPYLKSKQPVIMQWLDQVFTFISDEKGRPLCKTHGFGVTGHEIVRRYPWFSVDSTSWALSAGYGNILMPKQLGIAWDYTHPIQFNISDRDRAGNNSMLHIGPTMRKMVDGYFDQLGIDFTHVRNFQEHRLIVNAAYFMGLEAQLEAKPFKHRLRSWSARDYSKRAADFNYSPRIHLATMIKIQQQGIVLTELGVEHRLISYYDCRRYDPDRIDEYLANGFSRSRNALIQRAKSIELRRRMNLLKRLASQMGEVDDE